MTSAPVWLGLTLCLSFCRTAAAYAWFAAARSANAASWSGIKAAAKGDAASMLTLLALPAAATSLALALIDLLYIQARDVGRGGFSPALIRGESHASIHPCAAAG